MSSITNNGTAKPKESLMVPKRSTVGAKKDSDASGKIVDGAMFVEKMGDTSSLYPNEPNTQRIHNNDRMKR